MAKFAAEFYKRNSGGKLILQPFSGEVSTGIASTGAKENVKFGENLAMKTFKADYYIIPNLNSKGPNHASGGVAHLIQILNTVATHEVGHLLGLGHSSRLNTGAKNDSGSIMNPIAKASPYLVAPQYYHLGWTLKSEVIAYDGTANAEFELNSLV